MVGIIAALVEREGREEGEGKKERGR
ncbi:hypothetical protein L345_18043, partial [Ophiophagus hannah]